tara:strand:- start:577 stop:789 length:213 start_codon:yes stop_codon:yes gene_type:complete
MDYKEIVGKIEILKENFVNGNITSEDLIDGLDDLCCEMEECSGPFGMSSFGDDDHYSSFEETDFTKLEVI